MMNSAAKLHIFPDRSKSLVIIISTFVLIILFLGLA